VHATSLATLTQSLCGVSSGYRGSSADLSGGRASIVIETSGGVLIVTVAADLSESVDYHGLTNSERRCGCNCTGSSSLKEQPTVEIERPFRVCSKSEGGSLRRAGLSVNCAHSCSIKVCVCYQVRPYFSLEIVIRVKDGVFTSVGGCR